MSNEKLSGARHLARGAGRCRYRVAGACLALAFASHTLHASERSVRIIGEAFALDSDKLLYRELYCASDKPDTQRVIYRDASDALLASKTLDYRTGPTTPSYVQHNYYARDAHPVEDSTPVEESVAVELRSGSVATTVWTDGDRDSAKTVNTTLATDIPLVIDAGFDNFVTQHWESLRSGERQRFYFPFAGRDDLVQLRIGAAQCSYGNSSDQCFRLELDNWLLRMVVDPIELGYDPGQKRLTRYRGLSNIGDGSGEGLIVDIRYQYEDLPDLPCS